MGPASAQLHANGHGLAAELPATLPYGSTGSGRGGGMVRRALTAKPIAIKGASSSTRRLSLISTSVGTRGPACLSRLVSWALIWLSRSALSAGRP